MRSFPVLLLLLCALVPSAAFAAPDDFAGFWQSFRSAIKKDDRSAVQAMTKFPFLYDSAPHEAKDFDEVYRGLFAPKARACLAKAKPIADGGDYEAFCGEQIYMFSKDGDAWRFTEIGVND